MIIMFCKFFFSTLRLSTVFFVENDSKIWSFAMIFWFPMIPYGSMGKKSFENISRLKIRSIRNRCKFASVCRPKLPEVWVQPKDWLHTWLRGYTGRSNGENHFLEIANGLLKAKYCVKHMDALAMGNFLYRWLDRVSHDYRCANIFEAMSGQRKFQTWIEIVAKKSKIIIKYKMEFFVYIYFLNSVSPEIEDLWGNDSLGK